jgi:hypothetical protein
MLDINGQPLRERDTAMLLCEIIEISEDGVRVRIMNSDLEMVVGVKRDEVLGGRELVADSELTLFESADKAVRDPAAAPATGKVAEGGEVAEYDGVRMCRME